MFETPTISIEESYVLKRVLRGFRQLRSLILWKVCDDAMLQVRQSDERFLLLLLLMMMMMMMMMTMTMMTMTMMTMTRWQTQG